MYKIGEIEGYSVMRCEPLQNVDVIEIVSNEQMIETIKNSDAYHNVVCGNISNGTVKMITWLGSIVYRNITYDIQLARVFSVNFIGRKNGIKIIDISESYTLTQFEAIFTGEFKDLEIYLNTELIDRSLLVCRESIQRFSFTPTQHIQTCGKTKAEVEKNIQRHIDRIVDYLAPKYIENIDKGITLLEDKKVKCNKLFGVK